MAAKALITPFAAFNYHPHQAEAVHWMLDREAEDASHTCGGILADEMGLGKTWMTIGLLLNAPVEATLLLVPPVLQPQWCDALTDSGISYSVLGPASAAAGKSPWRIVPGARADIHVYLTTYDRAVYQSAELLTQAFDRILCDEGHVLRNGPKTKRYRTLSGIAAPRRWILSATPVQNKKSDFRNLLLFLGMPVEALRKDLARIADDVVMRRVVDDVRDVVTTMPKLRPLHIVHPVKFAEESEEERTFNALMGRFEYAVEASLRGTVILELYLRIRQFIAHPSIYCEAMKRKFPATYKRTWTESGAKHTAFKALLATEEKAPTIVFGHFRKELDFAKSALEAAGYEVYMIRGGMTERVRSLAVSKSREAAAAGRPVAVLLQIVAGSAGLNLQHCRRIVFLSSHWNPSVVDQAIARSYRMGQTERVTVHHLLLADDAEKNLDRYMAAKHAMKRLCALEIHPKLFSDCAADDKVISQSLDAALDLDLDFDL
jgi:SNF2 family DNA or RNA helicase